MTKESKTLMLVGFMGAGKTTVGQEIARQQQSSFIDIDAEIERVANQSIAEIFATRGEIGFRKLETQVLSDVKAFNGIVATGGGVVETTKNLDILKAEAATIVYLHGHLESTINRLLMEAERPMLQEKSAGDFFDLWQQRDSKYRHIADFTVETEGKTPERIAIEIMTRFRLGEDELGVWQLRSELDAVDRQVFKLIEKRMRVMSAVTQYTEARESQNAQESGMRTLLKYDFENSSEITDDMIDKIMAIVTTANINKENKQLKR